VEQIMVEKLEEKAMIYRQWQYEVSNIEERYDRGAYSTIKYKRLLKYTCLNYRRRAGTGTVEEEKILNEVKKNTAFCKYPITQTLKVLLLKL
jgi:hypothetical protein